MRVGLISDIHGNAVALEVCLGKLAALRVDQVFFLGDAVGYLPWEVEVVRRLKREGVHCQLGNHELMLLQDEQGDNPSEPIYQILPARRRLGAEWLSWIRTWPQSREMVLGSRRVLMVHGSPTQRLDGYVYPDADFSVYKNLAYDCVFMGHTHRPFVAHAGARLLVNVGSVGLPRDDGRLGAFAVYDCDKSSCHLYRFPFNVDALLSECRDLAPAVRQCLARRSTGEIAGEVLE